ncbi:unnamed protein product [Protopolystoma xenopodis]|uniref:Uncharacterized protein n=1 Tax=Protopolystoma xenopodis TaxID=117903 RepID=A0A3S5CPM2_9PLAT|nr:unnamed protein product [Protopolystoma xenopodis]
MKRRFVCRSHQNRTEESRGTAAAWLLYDVQVDAAHETSSLASGENRPSFRTSNDRHHQSWASLLYCRTDWTGLFFDLASIGILNSHNGNRTWTLQRIILTCYHRKKLAPVPLDRRVDVRTGKCEPPTQAGANMWRDRSCRVNFERPCKPLELLLMGASLLCSEILGIHQCLRYLLAFNLYFLDIFDFDILALLYHFHLTYSLHLLHVRGLQQRLLFLPLLPNLCLLHLFDLLASLAFFYHFHLTYSLNLLHILHLLQRLLFLPLFLNLCLLHLFDLLAILALLYHFHLNYSFHLLHILRLLQRLLFLPLFLYLCLPYLFDLLVILALFYHFHLTYSFHLLHLLRLLLRLLFLPLLLYLCLLHLFDILVIIALFYDFHLTYSFHLLHILHLLQRLLFLPLLLNFCLLYLFDLLVILALFYHFPLTYSFHLLRLLQRLLNLCLIHFLNPFVFLVVSNAFFFFFFFFIPI